MANYSEYHAITLRNLKYMKNSKSDQEKKSDFKRQFFEDSLAPETLQDEIFLKMFDIAWENCENNEKAKVELDMYLKELRSNFNEAQVLTNAIVAYVILTETARREFDKQKQTYLKAMRMLAIKRTASFISSTGQEKVFDLVPIERKFDEFGSWEIDRLFNHMLIYLVIPKDEKKLDYVYFPKLWRTDENVREFIFSL